MQRLYLCFQYFAYHVKRKYGAKALFLNTLHKFDGVGGAHAAINQSVLRDQYLDAWLCFDRRTSHRGAVRRTVGKTDSKALSFSLVKKEIGGPTRTRTWNQSVISTLL